MLRTALLLAAVLLVLSAVPALAISSGTIEEVNLELTGVYEVPFTVVEGVETRLQATAISPGMELEYQLEGGAAGSAGRSTKEQVWERGDFVFPGGLPADNYVLRVRPWQEGSPGTVRICYQTFPGTTTNGQIVSGQSVELNVQKGLWRSAGFSAGAGDRVIVFGRGGGQPEIFDESGHSVLADSWDLGTYVAWTLPAAGNYQLFAASDAPGDWGVWRLTLLVLPHAGATPLVSGETKTGALAAGGLHVYSFSGTDGEAAFIRGGTPAGYGEATLMLFEPGTSTPTNLRTDGAPGELSLTNGTWYLICYGQAAARYVVTFLRQAGPYTSATDPDGGTINSGETRNGTSTLADLDGYSLDATAGDVLAWRVPRGTTTACIILPNGRFEWSRETDLTYAVQQTGRHLIVCWGNSPGVRYGVTAVLRSGAQSCADDPDGGLIQSNDLRACTMAPGDLDAFKFSGKTGDVIFLRAVSPAGADGIFMNIISPDGTVLVDVAYQAHQEGLPQTGTYWAVFTSSADLPLPADYSLSFLKLPGRLTSEQDNDGGQVLPGETRKGYLRPADYDAFSFAGFAGDTVRVALSTTSTSLHTNLELYAANGAMLAQTQNAIAKTLGRTGTYYIVAHDESGQNTGPYSLVFENPPPRVLATRPTNGDTRAAPHEPCLTFSRPMDPDSFEGNVIYQKVVRAGATVTNVDLPFTLDWSDTRTVLLLPDEPVACGQRYRLVIKAAVTTSNGRPMGTAFGLNWVTSESPITSCVPGDGASGVPVATKVRVSFRWPVKMGSAEAKLGLTRAGAPVPCTWVWKQPRLVAELTPSAPLSEGTSYVLRLAAGLALADGFICRWDESRSFETAGASFAPPALTAATASADGRGAAFCVSAGGSVTAQAAVMSVSGALVATLPDLRLQKGSNRVLWNGRSLRGSACPSGRYLLRLTALGNGGAKATTVVPFMLGR